MEPIVMKGIQLLLSLSFLIVLHELGHFIPAKIFNTRVEKFFLFFDVKFALIKKKFGDTVYGIGWLPLGGYVKISGMIDESMDKEQMALPPCHAFFQFYVADGKLSCQLYQRSADIFLGVPFNIASYALLTMMMAQVCNLEVGDFVHTLGDAHIYTNHFEQTELQLSRVTKALPKMKINAEVKSIFDFTIDDFELVDYEFHPHIKGKVAI